MHSYVQVLLMEHHQIHVWAVVYNPALFTEELYRRGLLLVDADSKTRIQKFRRREDACRCLIGRILPRVMLGNLGIPNDTITFSSTQSGKPYIITPVVDPPIGFNISHDSAAIVMAFNPGGHDPPAYKIGVDVMKVRITGPESYQDFVQIFSDQLTAIELRVLTTAVTEDEGLRLFFWMWTMKEAYTKALGLGLGFDFRRVEYDVPQNVLTVDGTITKGWQFVRFEFTEGEDLYQGVAAEFVGGDETSVLLLAPPEWLTRHDAASFVRDAVQRMN